MDPNADPPRTGPAPRGRTRTWTLAGATVAALIAVAVIAVVAVNAQQSPPEPSDAVVPVLRDRIQLSGYPEHIEPGVPASPLPTDRAVGRGTSLYLADDGRTTVLMTDDGGRYRLPDDQGSSLLSPDGRWLLTMSNGRASTMIRDLSDTRQSEVDGSFSAWSPDLAWLVTAVREQGRLTGARVVRLDERLTSRTVNLTPYPGMVPVSVRSDGRVVLSIMDGEPDLKFVVAAGPSLRIDLAAHATAAELAVKAEGGLHPRFTSDTRLLVQLSQRRGQALVDGDVLVVDIDAQRVVERLRLPTPQEQPDGDVQSWTLVEQRNEGLVLLRHSTTKSLAFELYRPQTRELFPITDLPTSPPR